MRDPKPTSWHFARPQLAEHHLRAFDLGLISATALHAKRRMGKTEFLTKDLTPKRIDSFCSGSLKDKRICTERSHWRGLVEY